MEGMKALGVASGLGSVLFSSIVLSDPSSLMQVGAIYPAGSGSLQLPVFPAQVDLHPVLSDQVSSMTSQVYMFFLCNSFHLY